ncbi:hypothetical protein EI94DRAFT_1813453 [Lactarius quietus]|nr:hypothetical protein EI94DRAFT_1813453 [Lactarius quietus]
MAHDEGTVGLRPPDPLGTGAKSDTASLESTTPMSPPAPAQVPPDSAWTADHRSPLMAVDSWLHDPLTQSPVQYTQPLPAGENDREHTLSSEALWGAVSQTPGPVNLLGGTGRTFPKGLVTEDTAMAPPQPLELLQGVNPPAETMQMPQTGSALQAHASLGPSDGRTPTAPLPQTQGNGPDGATDQMSEDLADEATNTIRALRADINPTRLGLASYYLGPTDLAMRGEAIMDINADQLHTAVTVVVALLDLGIPDPVDTPFTGLVPSSWYRLTASVLAAALRGAKHTPNILKKGTADITPCLDTFLVHKDIPVPEMQGDLLQDMVAQLAGTLDTRPPLGGGDTNPESYFDAIKLKLNANYEYIAEAEARKEASLWAQRFTAGLYNNELNTIILKVQTILRCAKWADIVKRNHMDDLEEEVARLQAQAHVNAEKEVRDTTRREGKIERMRIFRLAIKEGTAEGLAEADAKLRDMEATTTKSNISKLKVWADAQLAVDKKVNEGTVLKRAKEEYLKAMEEGKESACRQAKVDLRIWAARYKAEKMEVLQQQLDATVAADDKQAVAIAVIKLGMILGDTDGARVPTARKKKRQVPNLRLYDLPNQGDVSDPHASVTPAPTIGCTHTIIWVTNREEIAETLSHIHTPVPSESGGLLESMHNPDAGVRGMLNNIALPPAFSNREMRGPHSSIHNPKNGMRIDLGPQAGAGHKEPSDEQSFILTRMQQMFDMLTERISRIETKGGITPTGPTQGPLQTMAAASGPSTTRPTWPIMALPPPTLVVEPRPLMQTTTATPLMMPGGMTVTSQAIHQNLGTMTGARNAAAAQGRTTTGRPKPLSSAPAPPPQREKALRARNPGDIVMEVRTLLERQTCNPIKVLSGRWSTTHQRTGNFVYTIAGNASVTVLMSFKKWLCQPFLGSELVPTRGWTWAQLRGVPTSDEEGTIWDGDVLLTTVLVAYVDKDKIITQKALEEGVFMFGYQVKFVLAGDKPALIQCGRCHELGHHKNAAACKVPRTALRCYRCRGNHDSGNHDFECKATHKTVGKCDCKAWCLLCSRQGHHARAHDCPKRGDFMPPKLACIQMAPPRATLNKPAATAPAARDVPTARVDDKAPLPVTGPSGHQTDPPCIKPKACIVLPGSKGKGKESEQAYGTALLKELTETDEWRTFVERSAARKVGEGAKYSPSQPFFTEFALAPEGSETAVGLTHATHAAEAPMGSEVPAPPQSLPYA